MEHPEPSKTIAGVYTTTVALFSEPPPAVWHYTDPAGLVGIVSSRRLWATSTKLLNDPTELAYGLDRISEWYRGYQPSDVLPSVLQALQWVSVPERRQRLVDESSVFVTSASHDGDSIGQWRAYASTSGYAIRFDTRERLSVFPDQPRSERLVHATPWATVAYEPERQQELIGLVVDAMQDPMNDLALLEGSASKPGYREAAFQLASEELLALAACIKPPQFEEEKEVRLIARLARGEHPLFRATARGVLPYAPVGIGGAFGGDPRGKAPHTTLQLPIRGVRVGPPDGPTMTQRIAGVKALLDASDLGSAPVNPSEIKYLP
ncbi:DUF2971 domain-containing protein [Microbacterium ginsengisoli]|nr:DUF2971 domain-containing protein [Microbacteriaceae bacterium K1510]